MCYGCSTSLSFMFYTAEGTTLSQSTASAQRLHRLAGQMTLFCHGAKQWHSVRNASTNNSMSTHFSYQQMHCCLSSYLATNPTACGCGEASAVTLRRQQNLTEAESDVCVRRTTRNKSVSVYFCRCVHAGVKKSAKLRLLRFLAEWFFSRN